MSVFEVFDGKVLPWPQITISSLQWTSSYCFEANTTNGNILTKLKELNKEFCWVISNHSLLTDVVLLCSLFFKVKKFQKKFAAFLIITELVDWFRFHWSHFWIKLIFKGSQQMEINIMQSKTKYDRKEVHYIINCVNG